MGADLYSVGFNRNQEEYGQGLVHAVQTRDIVAKAEGFDSDEYRKAQVQVDFFHNKIYHPDFYFRDSYNSTCVMWRLGLSWWEDVVPILDASSQTADGEDVNCSDEKCLWLAHLIQQRPLKEVTLGEERFEDESKEGIEEINLYFRDKHKALVRFLKVAAKHGGAYFSL
jgi:hypothetical protein